MAVKRTHKSKTLPKVMLSILKKSRCKKWIYIVTEFSRNSLLYVANSLKYPQDLFTEVLGNGDAEKLALACFSYFQISKRLQ